MTPSAMAIRQQYLGTARLLVETHNKLMKMLSFEGSVDEEQQEMMEPFVNDFNRTSALYIIKSTGNGRYGVFDRE